MKTSRILIDNNELSDTEKYFAIDYASEAAERWRNLASWDRVRVIVSVENRCLRDCGFNKALANECLRLFNRMIGR